MLFALALSSLFLVLSENFLTNVHLESKKTNSICQLLDYSATNDEIVLGGSTSMVIGHSSL